MSHPAKEINRTSYKIVNGEYDEAIVSLTKTLKTLKLVLSGDAKILVSKGIEDEGNKYDHGDDCMDCSSSSSSGSFQYDFFSSPTSSSFLKTAVSIRKCKIQNCQGDSSSSCFSMNMRSRSGTGPQQVSMFRDPIMVHGDHFKDPLDLHVCEELSYVAIYNLALAHHLKAIEIESEGFTKQNLRRIYLRKALSLYEHSHEVLTGQTINVGVPVIHSMAVVSNLSQIHHALGDHNKAEMCMQYLLSTMMYVIDCGKVDTLGNSMDGFFNMILPLISRDDPAPAA